MFPASVLDDDAWDDLLSFIEERRVIPIVGPELLMVSTDTGPRLLYDWLAEKLARRLNVDTRQLPHPYTLNDAAGALSHLVIHSRWLSLITTVFPALAAALHGALAQSEAYRLHAASERVAIELQAHIENLRLASGSDAAETAVKSAILSAVSLILQEHQDWYMLVKPHHLPLG